MSEIEVGLATGQRAYRDGPIRHRPLAELERLADEHARLLAFAGSVAAIIDGCLWEDNPQQTIREELESVDDLLDE